MRAMVCEMCGSHDLVKQDGLYICQHCNTKYSVDEAKKLFADVSDENPLPVKVVKKEERNNYKQLALTALTSERYQEAEEYCKRALEISPNDYELWKVRAISAVGLISPQKDQNDELFAYIDAMLTNSNNDPSCVALSWDLYLQAASVYLSVALTLVGDQESAKAIHRYYRATGRVYMFSASDRAKIFDTQRMEIVTSYGSYAISLLLLFTENVLRNNPDCIDKVDFLNGRYEILIKAIERRAKMYGQKLTSSSKNLYNGWIAQVNDNIKRARNVVSNPGLTLNESHRISEIQQELSELNKTIKTADSDAQPGLVVAILGFLLCGSVVCSAARRNHISSDDSGFICAFALLTIVFAGIAFFAICKIRETSKKEKYAESLKKELKALQEKGKSK